MGLCLVMNTRLMIGDLTLLVGLAIMIWAIFDGGINGVGH
jgi:hypothetical protein